jgi:hypothetical protein
MSVLAVNEGRKVSIPEARQLAATNPDVCIVWRPEEALPESEQYALVYNE